MFVNTMQKYGLLLISVIWIAGCAAPNPLANVSNLSEKDLGQVVALVFKKPVQIDAPDEPKNFQHWVAVSGMGYHDRENMQASIDFKLGHFDKYCSSLGGTLIHKVPEDRRVQAQVVCEQGNSNTAIFLIAAYTANCTYNNTDDSGRISYYSIACNEWVDAFHWKSPGPLSDFEKEYKFGTVANAYSLHDGYVTARVANAQKESDREDASRKSAQFTAEFNRKMKLQQDSELQAKTVGQKICRHVTATQRKVIGYAMNEPVYGAPTELYAKVTGFTEQLSADKIQIRISGIQANGKNLNRIDGDVVIENGAVIWDNPKKWGLCD